MVLCEWDAPEGDPGQSCVHLFARILSTSFSSVSIFSVCCYSRVSISMVYPLGCCSHEQSVESMGRRPLPAVRDFTRDGRWCTYDVSERKRIGGIMRRDRLPSKATISNKSRPAGSFSSS
jgi:hypothetical protein